MSYQNGYGMDIGIYVSKRFFDRIMRCLTNYDIFELNLNCINNEKIKIKRYNKIYFLQIKGKDYMLIRVMPKKIALFGDVDNLNSLFDDDVKTDISSEWKSALNKSGALIKDDFVTLINCDEVVKKQLIDDKDRKDIVEFNIEPEVEQIKDIETMPIKDVIELGFDISQVFGKTQKENDEEE